MEAARPLLLCALLMCALSTFAADKQQQSAAPRSEPTAVQIEAGTLQMPGGAVLHVQGLSATSIPHVSSQQCKCKESTIEIHSGRLSVTDTDLAKLLNHKFEKNGENKHIEVTAEGDKLKFKGSKAAGIPIDFEARPVPLADGRIQLVSSDIKAGPLPIKGLLHVFGLNMDDMMHPKTQALSVEKDNLIVDLEHVSKNPKLVGHVKTVSIQGHNIVLTFGGSKAAAPQKASSKNQKGSPKKPS